MDKKKLLSMIVILAAIVVIAGGLTRLSVNDSMSLAEYASINASAAPDQSLETTAPDSAPSPSPGRQPASPAPDTEKTSPETPAISPLPQDSASPLPENSLTAPPDEAQPAVTPNPLTGAALNGDSLLEQRTELAEGFYYEPISDKLRRYMTGVSFPVSGESNGSGENSGTVTSNASGAARADVSTSNVRITFEELRYVHILHYDFDGRVAEGELVCNEYIAQDLVEIFYELYRNEYQLERVLLIDEYNGDDTASMEDNNTSCFNYRPVAGSASLSKHALGLAVDINPLYNPYITYTADGEMNVSPASAQPYADRSGAFPYKIDADDLCSKLFLQHGFTWGGNWNNVKDYQHFQKVKP